MIAIALTMGPKLSIAPLVPAAFEPSAAQVPAGVAATAATVPPAGAKRGAAPAARSLTSVQAPASTVPARPGAPRKVPSEPSAEAGSADVRVIAAGAAGPWAATAAGPASQRRQEHAWEDAREGGPGPSIHASFPLSWMTDPMPRHWVPPGGVHRYDGAPPAWVAGV